MNKTIFSVPKMDCPSEEKLIRMALANSSAVKGLEFDLQGRRLTVTHEGLDQPILEALKPLNFGAVVAETRALSNTEMESIDDITKSLEDDPSEAKVLKWLLAINGIMFIIEIVLGFVAHSTGLIADAMDMFADAAVYAISLYAVGKALSLKNKAARFSGFLQMALAAFALFEVIRRFYYGGEPIAQYMIVISVIALIANVTCLALISKHREGGVHMKASWIFSANDVIANMGVIIAGALVSVTKSQIPDLVIGLIISAVVFRGAIAILRISNPAKVQA